MALEIPQWGDAASDPQKLIQLLDQLSIQLQVELEKGSPIGEMAVFPVGNAVEGWLPVDGSEFNQSKFPQLFKKLQTTWGGTATTFNIPDVADLPTLPDADMQWMIRVE